MTTTEDRERTRNQLQGLAQLAKQVSPDSSGYVDLSAFSSSDAPTYGWVDQALAHSRGSEPPKIDRLDSESMRPVALESLLDPREVGGANAKTERLQKAFIIASSVCIAGLAVAAIALAIRSPDAHSPAPSLVAASVVAVAAPAQVQAADPPALTAPPAQAAVPVAVADTTTLAPQAPQGTPGSSKHGTTKKKLVAPAAGSRVHTRASGSATSSNAWLGGGGAGGAKKSSAAGGDSLMGAIQQSIAAPKK